MSPADKDASNPSAQPTRVLIAGSNLLAGTLARTLETHGFVTIYTAANAQEIERKLEWGPDLVLIDLRPFNVKSGSTIVTRVRKSGRQVCVIDDAGDGDRPSAWLRAGSAAVVSENEPFDRLFQTITRLTRVGPPPSVPPAEVASTTDSSDTRRRNSRLDLFARLTEREQVVLSELMEGHCAEDIAKAAVVSIWLPLRWRGVPGGPSNCGPRVLRNRPTAGVAKPPDRESEGAGVGAHHPGQDRSRLIAASCISAAPHGSCCA
jgi:DNA-binding NarL/FixJ family response regulator